MSKISKTQIDRLGGRLRKGSPNESDLKTLDDYRRSFGGAYEEVVSGIREKLKLEPTGRPAKSTSSIIEKLNRESIRLSQVQDIAGCRVVVADILEQDNIVASLKNIFPRASVVDRRINPSYGYRAVHIIIKIFDKLIEVQIRTELQHSWAETSEKFSDKIDPAIKYGGGDKEIQSLLCKVSNLVNDYEKTERKISTVQKSSMDKELKDQMANIKKDIANFINKHAKLFL